MEITAGRTCCHLFGGRATFGTRIDIDPIVRPHVIADAWMPPFAMNAFDVVILDPPYVGINQQMKDTLVRGAAYMAKDFVIWFHTMWIASAAQCVLERAWLVRVGDSCAVRCLQVFRTPAQKMPPVLHFTRGPALRYNRWLDGQQKLHGLESDEPRPRTTP